MTDDKHALALTPSVGDIVRVAYWPHSERRVQSVTRANIVYLTPAANGGWWKRSCLPVTWARWCRKHKAFVDGNDSIR